MKQSGAPSLVPASRAAGSLISARVVIACEPLLLNRPCNESQSLLLALLNASRKKLCSAELSERDALQFDIDFPAKIRTVRLAHPLCPRLRGLHSRPARLLSTWKRASSSSGTEKACSATPPRSPSSPCTASRAAGRSPSAASVRSASYTQLRTASEPARPR